MRRFAFLIPTVALGLWACGSDDSQPAGSGGAAGTAGGGASGAASGGAASGGSAGFGGVGGSSAGSAGASGAAGSAGAAGAAGSMNVGGAAGAAGSMNVGGAAGSAGSSAGGSSAGGSSGAAGTGGSGISGSGGAGGAADPFAGRPLGQCVKDSDCPGNLCNHAVPGGQCQGAGCPNGTVNNGFGCVYECTSIDDCPPGLRCLGQGVCGIIACSGGLCPIPMFDCGEVDRCARVDCGSQADCPADTTCTGGHCIENRALGN